MRVVSNTAVSLDGRINTREGRFTTLGTDKDHARMSRLRTQADAVLVGGATFRLWPHPSFPREADRDPSRGPLWNVVVTRSLNLPLLPDFVTDRRIRPLVLTSARPATPPPEGVQVEVHDGPGGSVPVPWILEVLARRGVETLLIEAGGDLLFQFLAAGALDELYVTLCPMIIGGDAPSLADGEGFPFAHMPRLRQLSAEVEGDEIFLHYQVRRDPPA